MREGTLLFVGNQTLFGANPDSSYAEYLFPWTVKNSDSRAYDVYKFCSRDALIFIGQTPPIAEYYSSRTYLYSRQTGIGTTTTATATTTTTPITVGQVPQSGQTKSLF